MYRIEYGSTHNLKDTAAFIESLNRLSEELSLKDFFDSENDLIVTRAPGRLDLMGGIADYSGSLVLQLPLEVATHVALQRHKEETLRIVSVQNGRTFFFEMSLADFLSDGKPISYADAHSFFQREPNNRWAAYIAGAFLVLMRERGVKFTQGANILIHSSVPSGKGVSSSAAIEVATMKAIATAYEIELRSTELAFLCQTQENLIAGAPCGIMDQMTSACGEAGELLELVCQPAELKGCVKLPKELCVWGIDSGIRHSVGGSDYGTVRTAAFMGYRIIAAIEGLKCSETKTEGRVEIEDTKWNGYLANITTEEFEKSYAHRLPKEMSGAEFLREYKGITDSVTIVNPAQTYPVYQATQHPIYENARVNSFAEILKNWQGLNQAKTLGELMYGSHEGYSACGLGSDGTDKIVSLIREEERLYGARITGGGSGGTVAVLGKRDAQEAVNNVAEKYEQQTGYKPLLFSGSSPGANDFGYLRLTREN